MNSLIRNSNKKEKNFSNLSTTISLVWAMCLLKMNVS